MNTLSFPRKALVKLPERFRYGVTLEDGTEVPAEKDAEGVYALMDLPPMGSVTLRPADAAEEAFTLKARAYREDDGYVMENDRLFVRLNEQGEVVSLIRKDSGREFAGCRMNRFRLYKDVPRLFDAWDIDSHYIEQELPGLRNAAVEIVKQEGIFAALKLTGEIGNSRISQEIVLRGESDRLEFRTTADWHELHRLLKVSFPSDVHTASGINEVQFGYVERPTHRSRQYDKDRFEVSNHRYSVLADGSHGLAVLNDCKYGISMNGNALELTLLRAAASPEMRADNGTHTFTYAVMPFEGSFSGSDVVREGLDLNAPVRLYEGVMHEESLVRISRKNVILDTVKPAEDGSRDVILRFYEAQKAPGMCTIETALRGRAYLCDLLEQKEQEVPFEDGVLELKFGPFEILTVRICPEETA